MARLTSEEAQAVQRLFELPPEQFQEVVGTLHRLEMGERIRIKDSPLLEIALLLCPPQRLSRILRAVEAELKARLNRVQQMAERNLRQIAEERGLDWEKMSNDEKDDFIYKLIHEDNSY